MATAPLHGVDTVDNIIEQNTTQHTIMATVPLLWRLPNCFPVAPMSPQVQQKAPQNIPGASRRPPRSFPEAAREAHMLPGVIRGTRRPIISTRDTQPSNRHTPITKHTDTFHKLPTVRQHPDEEWIKNKPKRLYWPPFHSSG